MATDASKPVVLLLQVGRKFHRRFAKIKWGSLFTALEARSDVKYATTTEEAKTLMDLHRNPRGIFVSDSGITKKRNNGVTRRLVRFVRTGGTVIFGAEFSSSGWPDSNEYFEEAWSLPWKRSDGRRSPTVYLNTSSAGRPESGIPPSYRLRGSPVENVNIASAWYVAGEDIVWDTPGSSHDPNVDEAPLTWDLASEGTIFKSLGFSAGLIGDTCEAYIIF
ncbi:hypothetical protein ACRE_070210 [Hapsidospora chrysogenum ATCC 11550]|uniref:Uncharacterized protein n=1 Tax=Hapsidospora chrysogenum (strain ATCC 11550 / CBS 779.69 / DSM 880 / IAM 14645 / JCM 23072 / IMI 49137) TaxID=857340 RepID=A0A086SYQ4_HAPC1|nr:hypothetical protein ACRE_070210 [Hapsidospora chrysogenum ATCC 11550]